MELTQLNEHFAIPGVLAFHQTPSGLIYADVTTPHATATIYLQGAHLTAWQPAGEQPVLFLSRKSDFEQGKPIRGGAPIAFPWFANRHDGKAGPSHGFARIQDWTLAFAALAGEDLHLTFTLAPTAMSRELGFDNFRLAYRLVIGRTLTMQLAVANDAATPLVFEEALHTYYAVDDIHEVTVTGLEPTPFIDKTDAMREKPAAHAPLSFTGPTDRVYQNTAVTCVLHDGAGRRRITVAKTNSNTTVVFNPWKAMADMGEDEWHEMLCVETVNAAANTVTLAPGETHAMQAVVSVEKTPLVN
ncbi:D-hexose-6-phosphate mutarotase [Edaphobacter dinghuensis]|uniref:Putative glucose-6-phosphate 1-epimerase n=1 Tax=Edaphobacter dinghuensis TaxID=1560005 RepID=A0A917M0C6_9BACT|nr:D-hexose-6-phosphate mutarotase [Edaphobacter dinghuensis]GGG67570.1 D-hexose-6-phosphate mutarotase [Edaphobacter dinghuensis]